MANITCAHDLAPTQGHALPTTPSLTRVLGRPQNSRALSAFRHHVVELWRRALRRCSQRDRTTWRHVDKLADRWLPKPRVSHPWPSQRFRVKHPRWEPYAGIPPVRFCAGGGRSAMSVPTAILIDFARGRPTNPARIPVSPSGRWHQITDPPARPRSAGSRSLKTATARVQPAEARCTFTGKHTMSNPSGGNCARLPSFSI
jgi:hypothetical protein